MIARLFDVVNDSEAATKCDGSEDPNLQCSTRKKSSLVIRLKGEVKSKTKTVAEQAIRVKLLVAVVVGR